MLNMIGHWLDKKMLSVRLLWVCLGTVGIIGLLWIAVIAYFMQGLDRAGELRYKASQVLRFALEAEREEKSFLLDDTQSKIFLETGETENLKQHREAIASTRLNLDSLGGLLVTVEQRAIAQDMRGFIDRYENKFEEIVRMSRSRGNVNDRDILRQELRLVESALEPAITKLVLESDAAAAIAKRHLMIAGLLITVFGFILLRLVIAALLSRGIIQSLSRVVRSAQEIASGNLSQEKLPVTTADEIGQLAAAFNEMLSSLRDIAQQTRGATETIGAASSQILASTQQQAASAKEQAAAVHETTSTVEEVRQAGHQISERAKAVATAVEATSSASNVGLKAVEGTVETMETIRQQVEAVAQNIVALSEKTQAIGEIIQTVNDIAEQSHLLSLNAAIEAAAAGESGRRFTVVASEIKNLSDQAKESTTQVRGILGDIQKRIGTSVMLTEEAVKRVESGRKQSDLAEKTIREFTGATQESIQAFQQILGATNQQQIGYDQVTQALRDILKASEQTAAGTSQLEKGVIDLNAMSQQLRKAAERYRL